MSYFFQSVGKIYCAKLRLPAKGVFAYLLRACGNLARSAPRNHRVVRFSRQTVALAGKRFVVFGHGYFFKSDAKLRQSVTRIQKLRAQRKLFQRDAGGKRLVAYTCHAVGQSYAFKRGAP